MYRFDIRWIPFESWGTGLLHSTGSDEFNKMIRGKLKSLGYTFSEHGLFNVDTKEQIAMPKEEDIFKFLGMSYVRPADRNG